MKTLSLLLLLFAFAPGFSQTDSLIRQRNTSQKAHLPSERVYVVSDKTLYKSGETIYYAAYVVDGANRPQPVSKLVIVELFRPDGSLLDVKKVALKNGRASGGFQLYNQPGGLYKLKAYTNYLANFGQDYHFIKEIMVQDVYLPELLLQLSINGESYTAGETVKASASIKDNLGKPLPFHPVNCELELDGIVRKRWEVTSDASGAFDLSAVLPSSIAENNPVLRISGKLEERSASTQREIPIRRKDLQVQFYPEAGHFLAGTEQLIAFKASNKAGTGLQFKGEIRDGQGKVVAKAETAHKGMGQFRLLAEAGKNYYLVNENNRFELPQAELSGYSLQFVEAGIPTLRLLKQNRPDSLGFVLIRKRDSILQLIPIAWNNCSQLQVELNPDAYASGILDILLLDEKGFPMAERLFFNPEKRNPALSWQLPQKVLRSREKAEIRFRLDSSFGLAGYTFRAIDQGNLQLARDEQSTLAGYLFMEADLRGKIEAPAWYFKDGNDPGHAKLGLLLLVHGYREIQWEKLMAENAWRNWKRYSWEVEEVKGRVSPPYDVDNYKLLLLPEKREITLSPSDNFVIRSIDGKSLRGKELMLNKGKLKNVKIEEVVYIADSEYQAPYWNRTISSYSTYYNNNGSGYYQQAPSRYFYDQNYRQGISIGGSRTNAVAYYIDGVRVNNASLPQEAQRETILSFPSRSVTSLAGTVGRAYRWDRPFGGNPQIYFMSKEAGLEYMQLYQFREASNTPWYMEPATMPNRPYPEPYRSPYWLGFLGSTQKDYVRYYAQSYDQYQHAGTEQDLRSTLHWNPLGNLDSSGEGREQFFSNDKETAIRLILEGISEEGIPFYADTLIRSQPLLSYNLDVPQAMGEEDILDLPLRLDYNGTENTTVLFYHEFFRDGNLMYKQTDTIQLLAGQDRTHWLHLVPLKRGNGMVAYRIIGAGIYFEDRKVFSIREAMTDSREAITMSGSKDNIRFYIDSSTFDYETHFYFRELPDAGKMLKEAGTMMLQEPHGCFEQVSSSNYPNIVSLQMMNTGADYTTAKYAEGLKYLKSGYHQLKNYEVPGGGFEWYGNAPAHQSLTAYGLIQFKEMEDLIPIDQDMVNRNKKWLLSQKNPDGSFRQNQGKYGFAGAPVEVSSAYITWVLSVLQTPGLDNSVAYVASKAHSSQDAYLLVLLCNIYAERGDTIRARETWNNLAARYSRKWETMNARMGVMYSYNSSLNAELLGFMILGGLKCGIPLNELLPLQAALLLKRQNGSFFGNTQATVIAYKALTQLEMRQPKKYVESSRLLVFNINGNQERIPMDRDHRFARKSLSTALLKPGWNEISYSGEDSGSFSACEWQLAYSTYLPQRSPYAPKVIDYRSSWVNPVAAKGEVCNLHLQLSNLASKGQAQTVAIIPIPPGMSLDPTVLKEWKKQQRISYYEVRNNELVLYFLELAPKGIIDLYIPFRAEVYGMIKPVAGSAYVYYNRESKVWSKPGVLTIPKPLDF